MSPKFVDPFNLLHKGESRNFSGSCQEHARIMEIEAYLLMTKLNLRSISIELLRDDEADEGGLPVKVTYEPKTIFSYLVSTNNTKTNDTKKAEKVSRLRLFFTRNKRCKHCCLWCKFFNQCKEEFECSTK